MMMQYLYYGGTESMAIPTADILEVSRAPAPLIPSAFVLSSSRRLQGSAPLSKTAFGGVGGGFCEDLPLICQGQVWNSLETGTCVQP